MAVVLGDGLPYEKEGVFDRSFVKKQYEVPIRAWLGIVSLLGDSNSKTAH